MAVPTVFYIFIANGGKQTDSSISQRNHTIFSSTRFTQIILRASFGIFLSFFLQLERSVHRFTTFYSSQHSGRKLNWLYNMSKGELLTNCFKNRYTLQASTFQMAVLLQYNVATLWTIQQLHESTQIKMDFLLQVSYNIFPTSRI